jgi:hypothetical protein
MQTLLPPLQLWVVSFMAYPCSKRAACKRLAVLFLRFLHTALSSSLLVSGVGGGATIIRDVCLIDPATGAPVV